MTGLERLSKFKHEREINNKKTVENITTPDDSLDTIKTEALARVVNDLAPDFSPDLLNQQQNRELETKVQEATTAVLTENGKFMSRAERQQLIREVMNEIVGLGPIEPLVARSGCIGNNGERSEPGICGAQRADLSHRRAFSG